MLSDFKAGGFERIQVMPSNIFFAGKFPEMQMTPARCVCDNGDILRLRIFYS